MISIRKRGNSYQYCFDIGKVNGKRKQMTKCGFRTKSEALLAGQRAYNEFINGGVSNESQMTYADYLEYWMSEYFEINYKYSKKIYGYLNLRLGSFVFKVSRRIKK